MSILCESHVQLLESVFNNFIISVSVIILTDLIFSKVNAVKRLLNVQDYLLIK